MTATQLIPYHIQRSSHSRLAETDFSALEFGKTPSDHFFMAEYRNGHWHDPRLRPFGTIEVTPFMLAFHYGQTVFEGMKAYRQPSGPIALFRPEKHFSRMNHSLDRMAMPQLPWELFITGLHSLMEHDAAWVPDGSSGALYMRPFMVASEDRIRVKVSDEYLFFVIASPVGAYFAKPLKLKVETEYVRAAIGGTGSAKCGGNYGASFYPTRQAQAQGYDQVLWTDSRQNLYIEEMGMMNVFFVFDGVLTTPALSNSILDGVTRDSIIQLARSQGMPVEERPISLDELERRMKDGSVNEAFGAGTAAVVSPIQTIGLRGQDYTIPLPEQGAAPDFKAQLNNIRLGLAPDTRGWNYLLPLAN